MVKQGDDGLHNRIIDRGIESKRLMDRLAQVLAPAFNCNHHIQIECLSVFICTEAAQHTLAIVQAGMLPNLVRLLSSSIDAQVQSSAFWVLGNITIVEACCDQVMDAAILPSLLAICVDAASKLSLSQASNGSLLELLRVTLWILLCLCTRVTCMRMHDALPVFTMLLLSSENDDQVIRYVCRSLCLVARDTRPQNLIALLLQESLVLGLVKQLGRSLQ
jgi:hypothetical protein